MVLPVGNKGVKITVSVEVAEGIAEAVGVSESLAAVGKIAEAVINPDAVRLA